MQLSDKALGRHLYVLGGTGVGKSRALETWIMQLIHQGEGVGVIDPHGELFHNLVARIAATGDHRLAERVVIINPLDSTVTVGFNPLEIQDGEMVERKALFLADVVTKIWRADPLITARMQRMMVHTFWLLASAGLTLLELPEVLSNSEFRKQLLAMHPAYSLLHHYWNREFPSTPRLVTEWTQSTLNKAGSLALDPDLQLLFGQQHSTIDFGRVLSDGLVLLVNLSKGELIAENSHLLGAFLMAQIQQTALARASIPARARKRWTLFVDEFQNYTTDHIQEILAESRKYKLSLVMAHQFYDQLRHNPELQAAVVNTVGNLVCFRLGYSDAEQFVHDIFFPPLEQIKDVRVRWQRVPWLLWEPLQRFDEVEYRQLDEIVEYETRRLTLLADRQFWYKQRGPSWPWLFRSLDMPDVVMTSRLQQAVDEVVACSNKRWARPKDEVRQEIGKRQHHLVSGSLSDTSEDKGTPKFWGE